MATATKLSGTYTADPVHSSFAFSVRYQGVSLFKGSLDEVDAKLVDGALEGAAKVESISIRTPEQFRAHVLSAEFFDAENHPTVDFRSNDIEVGDDGTAKVEGELTIKGITRPVSATGTWIEERRNLCAGRFVQFASRLVGEQQLRIVGEGTCDRDALHLAAGEL